MTPEQRKSGERVDKPLCPHGRLEPHSLTFGEFLQHQNPSYIIRDATTVSWRCEGRPDRTADQLKLWSDKDLISDITSYGWTAGQQLLNPEAKARMREIIEEMATRGLIHWRPT